MTRLIGTKELNVSTNDVGPEACVQQSAVSGIMLAVAALCYMYLRVNRYCYYCYILLQ